MPIAAILAREKAAVFSPGEHGSTFGGNPLACAVGFAVLSGVLANVREVGAYLMGELNKLRSSFDFITDVRGRGLLVALEFEGEISGKVIGACIERGLLLNPVKPNAIRFMPPLSHREATSIRLSAS